MATSNSQNRIQLLLVVEQEAQHIINTARTGRLEQAKEEAEKEIAEFRTQMEADFQRKLVEIRAEASRISPDVVSMLLRHVTTVKN
ncbi:hypothetical protein Pfo_027223 [Paulownia fortunei]|nr:hypothetical protein Pfo_027223 [Paulownia fortunei]